MYFEFVDGRGWGSHALPSVQLLEWIATQSAERHICVGAFYHPLADLGADEFCITFADLKLLEERQRRLLAQRQEDYAMPCTYQAIPP